MYCQKCGQLNEDNAYKCVGCHTLLHPSGQPAPPAPPHQPAPPNYLVHAVLATVLCCLPAGVVAIVYSAQVESKVAAGRMPEALAASKNAKTWCWVAFGCGALVWIITIGIFFLGMIAAVVEGQQ